MAAISTELSRLAELTQQMASSSLGIVDTNKFLEALYKARDGQEVPAVAVIRTLGIESWLKNLSNRRILVGDDEAPRESVKGLAPTFISAEKS